VKNQGLASESVLLNGQKVVRMVAEHCQRRSLLVPKVRVATKSQQLDGIQKFHEVLEGISHQPAGHKSELKVVIEFGVTVAPTEHKELDGMLLLLRNKGWVFLFSYVFDKLDRPFRIMPIACRFLVFQR
jgi:hypothetical protein